MHSRLKTLNVVAYPRRLFYAPDWIVLGVNNICNLHCKMCDVGTQTLDTNFAVNLVGTQPLNMPPELIRKVMDETAKWFPRTKIGYGFTEPLIYPHLIESLEYARDKKLYTEITTNGLNLVKHAADLCKAGLKEICISLDGPEEVHNFIRGHKSSFGRAVEGIEQLLSHKSRPGISVFCVITEWNIGHLEAFVDFFSRFPLDRLGFMHTNFTNAEVAETHNRVFGATYPATVSNVEQANVEAMDLDRLSAEIAAIREKQFPFPVVFSPELHARAQLEVFYRRPEQLIGKRCNDAFRNVMVKSDGSVIPAHGRCYNLTLGNLHQSSLREIWNSSVAAQFRSDLVKAGGLFPACSRCCSAF
jgi:Fe-coproporphyrin III synthase